MIDFSTLELGDKVRITRYMIGRMTASGPAPDDSVVGKVGFVTKIGVERYKSGYVRSTWVDVRVPGLPGDRYPFVHIDDHDRYEALELVEKGKGPAVAGVDYPFTEDELRSMRWEAFKVLVGLALQPIALEHEGWSNRGTWMANLYLTNKPAAMAQVPALIRKRDGKINPDRLAKLFSASGLELDDSIFDPPFDIPQEFKTWHIPGLWDAMHVHWDEIADDLATSHKRENASKQG
jgi:hypothetical protein